MTKPQKKFLKGLDLDPFICANLNDLEVATNKKSLKTLSLQGFDEVCYLYKRRARDSNLTLKAFMGNVLSNSIFAGLDIVSLNLFKAILTLCRTELLKYITFTKRKYYARSFSLTEVSERPVYSQNSFIETN